MESTTTAYAGIDVAFAKRKRLPIVICTIVEGRLEPLPLRVARTKPPSGSGNRKILEDDAVAAFAQQTAEYLKAIELEFGVCIQRIAIDAPSDPKPDGVVRRHCELGLDSRRISCITTPSVAEFQNIRAKANSHLADGGSEASMPGANQLWMLVGFELFSQLRRTWECIEVFPQAIAAILEAGNVHKSRPEGLLAQLTAVAKHTGWPTPLASNRLERIAFGSQHDRLDAYMAAWIASLGETKREPIGLPSLDAIWVPRLSGTATAGQKRQ